MDDKNFKIELSGNPFVDTGIGVIASLAKIENIDNLTLSDIKKVYGDGSQLIEWNSKLKTFSQIFGTNNPLYHPSYGYKNGPSETNKLIYRNILDNLLNEIGKPGDGPRCWACGNPSAFDFAQACKSAVEKAGKKAPEEKWVGRDWFPLAGSLGSDAQALPAASKPPVICPKCLFFIHYLPLGLILLDGRLAVFQSTSKEFWYELVGSIVDEVKSRVQSGNYETLGGKEGSRAVIRRLLILFERLEKEEKFYKIPKGLVLYAWRFSNSGASPECSIEEIPNPALEFLQEAVFKGLRNEVETLIENEDGYPGNSLYQCIINRKDYSNLYPSGKKKGASLKLFELYQTHICDHSKNALKAAHKLAKEIAIGTSEKELKRIQRNEAFREENVRNQFRSSMVRMVENGEFTLGDYLDLFPMKNSNGITVEWGGWNLIRFYLHHINEDDELTSDVSKSTNIHSPVFYYAGAIYNHYIKEKGMERFNKEVLGKMKLGKIGNQWLRNQFLQLSELNNGFTYGTWLRLCRLDDGNIFVKEMLFQMRLLWVQWIYENRTFVDILMPSDETPYDGLPVNIRTSIEAVFIDYINNKGIDRFHQDILLRLRKGEIGIFWHKDKLTNPISENIEPLSEEEWEEFLVDDEGNSAKNDRLFQLNLELSNLYRVKVNGK